MTAPTHFALDARQVLEHDGHGRTEGAFFERYTAQRLLAPLLGEQVTTGWWFTGSSGGRYHVFKIQDGPLGDTERSALQLLSRQAGLDLHLVPYRRSGQGLEYQIRRARRSGEREAPPYQEAGAYMTGLAEAEADSTLVKRPGRSPRAGRRDPARFERVFQAFAPHERERLAAERVFVNFILNRSFRWIYDLDVIAQFRGQLIGFEIKRKYPEPPTQFGINEGLRDFLADMTELLPVYHVILTSACWDKRASPFVLFDRPEVQANSVWIGKRLTRPFLEAPVDERIVQPRDFGLGSQPKRTLMYPVSAFSLLQHVARPADPAALAAFLEGRSPTLPANFLRRLRVGDR